MNYTEKYHLPQWEKEDRIMMDDFNQAMGKIETGMSGNAQAAAEAAKLPYVIGNYTGTGGTPLDIEVGFQPRFVIICRDQNSFVAENTVGCVSAAGETISSENRIVFQENGFHLARHDSKNPYPRVNEYNQVYNFIAFR